MWNTASEQRREYRLWPDGRARDGAAPFLDYAAPEEWERGIVAHVVGQGGPADARRVAEQWAASQWYFATGRAAQHYGADRRTFLRHWTLNV